MRLAGLVAPAVAASALPPPHHSVTAGCVNCSAGMVVGLGEGMSVRGRLFGVNASIGGGGGRAAQPTRAFLGIPYAAPPIGPLRLRAPHPAPAWDGVRDATEWGPSCLQLGCTGVSNSRAWVSINTSRCSEDCLSLNVFTPVGADSLPVMIYLHAGEFHFGSSHDAESDFGYGFGGRVVFVTVNSRVGPLGFGALDALRDGDPAHNSTGNYGLLDQRAAFVWVRNNIARFGGDAQRVTIFGESSGATAVVWHYTNPRSWGTFQRVIGESPGVTQTKPLQHSIDNTLWAVATVTFSTSTPACPRPATPNYRAWPQCGVGGHKLAKLQNVTVAEAQAACWGAGVNCSAVDFTAAAAGRGTAVLRGGWGRPSGTSDPNRTAYVKWPEMGPGGAGAAACLRGADAVDIIRLNEGSLYGDTFQTDTWAPAVDGAELAAPLSELLRGGQVAPGVDALMGSNLDEGTEFMYGLPSIACDASNATFRSWAAGTFGAELGAEVLDVYTPGTLQVPWPTCSAGRQRGVNVTAWWAAAMRSAGDRAIACRARGLLAAAAAGGAGAYEYLFSLTPAYSVNWPGTDLATIGSFHGAEVPFVFGSSFEITTDVERSIAQAMGCYWANFAESGDPNVASTAAPCAALPQWPPITDGDSGLEFRADGGIAPRPQLKQRQCDMFAQYD